MQQTISNREPAKKFCPLLIACCQLILDNSTIPANIELSAIMVSNRHNIELDHSLSTLKSWIEQTISNERIFVLVDHRTEKYCLPVLKQLSLVFDTTSSISVPSGENHKNMDSLLYILHSLTNHQAGRKSMLISLGGGVICDMGAFAANIYKRGMRSVLIPTTLLAQVDAAYGGKTGVDFKGHKNLIGSFSFPEKIFVSTQFLSTLPQDEKLNGIAEAFKHALIADRIYWDQIKNDPFKNIENLIDTSIRIKTSVVNQDPEEKGLRKILNAGHTIGHAIESAFLLKENPIAHGKAVAAGLIIELFLSNKSGYLSMEEMKESIGMINQFFPKLPIEQFTSVELIQLMKQDKKNSAEQISFSLIRKIGTASYDDQVKEELIAEGLQYYFEL